MYHEKSLKAGLATRANRCDNARDWDIRDDCLVWSNTNGAVSVQYLRSLPSKSIELDFRRFFPQPIVIEYLRLLPDTEKLVVTGLSSPRKDPNPWRPEKLIKMSTQQTRSWIVNLEASISRPAIGTDSISLVQGPPVNDENNHLVDNDHINLRFMKLKQSDGSVVLDMVLPSEEEKRWHGHGGKITNDMFLVSSNDESCVVWTD